MPRRGRGAGPPGSYSNHGGSSSNYSNGYGRHNHGFGRGQPQTNQFHNGSVNYQSEGNRLGGAGDQPQQAQAPLRPLLDFFNFSQPPPSLPQRASTTMAEAAQPVQQTYDERAKIKERDDNKNYVEHYRGLAYEEERHQVQARMQNLQLQNSETRSVSAASSAGAGSVSERKSETSFLGTLPSKRENDDPVVFWKYDMKQRKVDTSSLKINRSKDKLLSILHTRQVVIVEGFTGCGKTTQVPQFILDDAAENNQRCKIAVTQPRRIAAISVAQRVCDERGWKLGGLVGYQVGMDRSVSDDTRLVYMTTGVLLQLLIGKRKLNEYTHIIIDEVHERDLETDLLLLVIKKLMIADMDSETKILLMSATLNADKFINYFPSWVGKREVNSSAIIKVTQPSLHPISEHYLDKLAPIYGYEGFTIDGTEEPKLYQEAYEIAAKIIDGFDVSEHASETVFGDTTPEMIQRYRESDSYKSGKLPSHRGAVLVFLPGFMEIEHMLKTLTDYGIDKSRDSDNIDRTQWTILPLHSSITSDEQQKVFYNAASGFRKIILATNIAESSITVPDIKYVIDFCLTKSLSCDPATNYTTLRLEWASKNQCIQRRGRCGRVSSGHVFRMISRKFYTEFLPQDALPEMEKASLESVVLKVKMFGMDSPLQILALAVDPPKKSLIGRAVANLKEVGAMTLNVGNEYKKYDGDVTYLGKVMSCLPIDFRLGRLIMLGMVYGVLEDAIVIAAGLSTKSPFSFPLSKRLDAYISKLSWSQRTYSDCFALLNAFTQWTAYHRGRRFRSFSEERSYTRSHFLQANVMREISKLVDEIRRRLTNQGIFIEMPVLPDMERGIILKIVIAGSFYPNYFLRSRPNQRDYEKEIFREVSGFSPLNSVTFHGFPIEQPGMLYAKHIAEVLTTINSIPEVHFHASKVIVTFDPRGSKLGAISNGVYRAIKMRQLRHKITFLTLGRQDALEVLERAEKHYSNQTMIKSPKISGLPGIKESEIECSVAYMDSPNEFWIVRSDQSDENKRITDILLDDTKPLTIMQQKDFIVGTLCVFVDKESGQRFRVRIDAVRQNDVLIYYIDTGVSRWEVVKNIFAVNKYMIDAGLADIPAMAMQCRLSHIKPPTRSAGVWFEEAIAEFHAFLEHTDNKMIFSIFSVVDSVIAGKLINPNTMEFLGERLLLKNLADKMEEHRTSIDNNTARKLWKALNYDSGEILAHDERQCSGWAPQRFFLPPKLNEDTGSPVTLRGPNSPLEMSFASLCRSAHLKQVQVEAASVNSVALDQDPFHPCSRMLIAAEVSLSHRTGNIVARNTTMMPAIPGIVSLMTMVFCPKMELRIDDQGTKYTGCISGLGVDTIEGMGDPVYPDHDMEIIFDVQIDNQDIHLINSIRTSMNVLMKENASKHRNADPMREKLRSDMIKLIQRQRDQMDEIWPDSTHEWGVIPPSEKYQPSDTSLSNDKDVFPLHMCVHLNPISDEHVTPKNVFQAPPIY